MKKNNRYLTLIVSFLMLATITLAPEVSYSQSYHTNSKKAVNLYKKAKDNYAKKKYDKSIKLIDRALDGDEQFVEALQLKGDIAMRLSDKAMAITYYEKSLGADSTVFPYNAVVLANLYMDNGNYTDAIDVLKWYCNLKTQKEAKLKVAMTMLENAEFRNFAVNNPVDFQPINLGQNVNTDGDEYINQILPDGRRIYFTRRLNEKDENGYRIEGVYYSEIVDNEYSEAVPMHLDWKNKKRMGSVNISPDQKKMFFVGFDWLDSKGRGDIYMSSLEGDTWGKPENLGAVINTSTVESQPCVSANGKELYFTRYSRTYESTDIFMSEWSGGKWSNPKAITNINSKGNEMAPFIHPDGKTLYFASDGFPGMGGYDIFMSKRDEKGEWGKPKNLGFPLNTNGDEITFTVSADGTTAYISSIREEGMGGYDIYVLNLDPVASPKPATDTQRFILHNIIFEFDSATLDSISYEEIISIAVYLYKNTTINVEISGYTDNSGNYEHNMELSQQRADSVKAALVDMGINANRITARGYGQDDPIVPNDSEEHKAQNRRVEMRIY